MPKKILLVDDEISILEAFVGLLSLEGYECDIAFDGKEALEILAKYDFDLVITNLKMPKLNGFELLEKIKMLYPELPVIILSGILSFHSIKDLKAQGAFACFEKGKTLDLNKLLAKIKGAMG